MTLDDGERHLPPVPMQIVWNTRNAQAIPQQKGDVDQERRWKIARANEAIRTTGVLGNCMCLEVWSRLGEIEDLYELDKELMVLNEGNVQRIGPTGKEQQDGQ